jgi:hypothetical protein
MSRKDRSKAKIATRSAPGRAQRLAVFGPPLLLEGEDATAYDELLSRICAAVKPIDIVDEIFIADIVSLELEVLRWRRSKWSLIRAHGLSELEYFLAGKLDQDLYFANYVDHVVRFLEDNLPEDEVDSAQTLADKFVEGDKDVFDKVIKCFPIERSVRQVLDDARADKAKKLVQEYVRGEREAVTLINGLTDAGVSLDTFMTEALREKINDIERIDRLTAIAETRRNAALREIDRRRAVLGETLRRTVQDIEDGEFEVIETMPAKGKNAA